MNESEEAAERWRSGDRPARPKRKRRSRAARDARKAAAAPRPPEYTADDDPRLTPAAREEGRRGVASLRAAIDGSKECEGS